MEISKSQKSQKSDKEQKGQKSHHEKNQSEKLQNDTQEIVFGTSRVFGTQRDKFEYKLKNANSIWDEVCLFDMKV